jgi:uncharacterized protein
MTILIAAALLHDIGREYQLKHKGSDHALIGAQIAFDFLVSIGWSIDDSHHVKGCITTHRFRNNSIPETIEAKILYDADKLDVIGSLGIARTLLYNGATARPLYSVDSCGHVVDGHKDTNESFFSEFNVKLNNVHTRLFTDHAKKIATERIAAATAFYDNLYSTVKQQHETGQQLLTSIWNSND